MSISSMPLSEELGDWEDQKLGKEDSAFEETIEADSSQIFRSSNSVSKMESAKKRVSPLCGTFCCDGNNSSNGYDRENMSES